MIRGGKVIEQKEATSNRVFTFLDGRYQCGGIAAWKHQPGRHRGLPDRQPETWVGANLHQRGGCRSPRLGH